MIHGWPAKRVLHYYDILKTSLQKVENTGLPDGYMSTMQS